MKKKIAWFIFLVVTSFLLFGCATKIAVPMLQPANYHEASLIKTVAVMPFSGPGGNEFSFEIETLINGINVGDKPYFTLVDRDQIRKVISEMKFGASGMVDHKTAVRLGKMIQAKGIYTGMVSVNKTKDEYYREDRSACQDKKCKYQRKWTVSCTKRIANFSAAAKLINVETGRVAYSQNLSGMNQSTGCEDTESPIDSDILLANARNQALENFRNDIAPYYTTNMIRLFETTDNIDISEAKDKLKNGLNWARNKRFDMACSFWKEAHKIAPDSPALLYNLGVCYESEAKYKTASELYRKAERVLGEPNEDITLAISRIDLALINQQKLKAQLK